MKIAVFLDRDGVINKSRVVEGVPLPPKDLSEVEILPGVREAIKLFQGCNLEVVVVTNQPDVARGSSTQESIEAINRYLGNELQINHFYSCFHDDPDGCECRKPKPGLLWKAALDLKLDARESFMVGDRWRDIAAGQAADCKCFFIDYGYKEKSPIQPYRLVSSLIEAAKIIVEEINDNNG